MALSKLAGFSLAAAAGERSARSIFISALS